MFLTNVFCGGSGLNCTPLNASGMNIGIIIALNIRVDSIAVSGLCNCMTFRASSLGLLSLNIAGRMVKYFAASFAMLNVVMAPRVISNCLPSSLHSESLKDQSLGQPYWLPPLLRLCHCSLQVQCLPWQALEHRLCRRRPCQSHGPLAALLALFSGFHSKFIRIVVLPFEPTDQTKFDSVCCDRVTLFFPHLLLLHCAIRVSQLIF